MDCQINQRLTLPSPENCKIIACETVIEELIPIIPPAMKYEVLDFGLHIKPEALKNKIQDAIKAASKESEFILLGYGLCSQALVGIKADNCTLVVPKVDDCIAIFLGSVKAYKQQHQKAPGTYYLTKGWIEVGDTPFDEYEAVTQKYGKMKADCIFRQILKNYTRLAFISTGNNNLDYYHTYTRRIADQFNLQYEEIQGSDILAKQLLYGPWDENFLVIPAGQSISFLDFRTG